VEKGTEKGKENRTGNKHLMEEGMRKRRYNGKEGRKVTEKETERRVDNMHLLK
jgi:hypothetical protein